MSKDRLDRELYDGISISEFKHLSGVSSYNSNYYSYKEFLLYALSDDDAITEWFVIRGEWMPIYIGYSDIRDEIEVLYRKEKRF